MFVNDLVAFDRLIPDEFFAGTRIKRATLGERLQQFSEEDLQVIADNGQKLRATLKLIEPRFRKERFSSIPWKVNPYTGQPIPGPPKDKRVLYAELIYPFTSQPHSLTIIPPLDEESNISKVPIGFMTYHRGLPIMDFRYLSRQESLTLDWADPWYSRFDNKNLWRTYNEPICAFLYTEPYETRVEIIIRPRDAQQWCDLGIAGLDTLPVDIQAQLKKTIADFLLTRMVLSVDGKTVTPGLQQNVQGSGQPYEEK